MERDNQKKSNLDYLIEKRLQKGKPSPIINM